MVKIRVGFVSNSSSSSFCIHKSQMTDSQIEAFQKILDEKCGKWNEDDYFNVKQRTMEVENYFIGYYDDHGDNIKELIKDLKLTNFALVGEL